MGVYNLDTDSFVDLGPVADLPLGEVVLAAFSPIDNLLYVAGQDTDELYTIDVDASPLTATSLGQVTKSGGGTLNIHGADLVFGADGTLYVWVNRGDIGLQQIDNLEDMTAVYKGAPETDVHFPGLAIREAGTGTLVGSVRDGNIWEVDRSDASVGTAFEPWDTATDTHYSLGYGDMTVGGLRVPIYEKQPIYEIVYECETAWAAQTEKREDGMITDLSWDFLGHNWATFLKIGLEEEN